MATQAVVLSLTDSPPYAVYQHLQLDLSHPGLLALLAVLIVLALALTARWLGPLFHEIRNQLRPVQTVAFLVLVGASLAVPAVSLKATAIETAGSAMTSLLFVAFLVMALRAIPDAALDRLSPSLLSRMSLPGSAPAPLPWDRWIPRVVSGWVLVAGSLICLRVFDGIPHIDDSVSYLFQAKYFSTGQLSLPAPPDSASFHVAQTVIDRGRWFAYGFPGWPAILALGVKLGAPWLVNPVLAALVVLVTHALLRRTHGAGVANLAVILMGASPWFLFMAGEYLGHLAAALWLMLGALGVEIEREKGGGRGAALAGVAMGALLLTRPLDLFIGGSVIGAWALGWLGRPRLPIRSLAIAGTTAVMVGSLSLGYNAKVTGNALSAAHHLWTDRAWGPGTDRLGFGSDIGIPAWRNIDPLPGHGPADVALNLNKNLFQTNVDLLGFGCGSILLMLLFLVGGKWRPADRFLIALALAFPIGYSAYWFSGGPDHGARYWFGAFVPFIVLSVRGWEMLARDTAGSQRRVSRSVIGLAVAVVGALLIFVPWRAAEKYHRYRDMSRDFERTAQDREIRDGLIFIRSPRREAYQSAFSLNPPTLASAGNIWAWDRERSGAARVASAFPTRPIWVFMQGGRDDEWAITGPFPAGAAPP